MPKHQNALQPKALLISGESTYRTCWIERWRSAVLMFLILYIRSKKEMWIRSAGLFLYYLSFTVPELRLGLNSEIALVFGGTIPWRYHLKKGVF